MANVCHEELTFFFYGFLDFVLLTDMFKEHLLEIFCFFFCIYQANIGQWIGFWVVLIAPIYSNFDYWTSGYSQRKMRLPHQQSQQKITEIGKIVEFWKFSKLRINSALSQYLTPCWLSQRGIWPLPPSPSTQSKTGQLNRLWHLLMESILKKYRKYIQTVKVQPESIWFFF